MRRSRKSVFFVGGSLLWRFVVAVVMAVCSGSNYGEIWAVIMAVYSGSCNTGIQSAIALKNKIIRAVIFVYQSGNLGISKWTLLRYNNK